MDIRCVICKIHIIRLIQEIYEGFFITGLLIADFPGIHFQIHTRDFPATTLNADDRVLHVG